MKVLRIVFVLSMLINTSCTVVFPSTGGMVNYRQQEEIRCQPFALPNEPGAPDIPKERYNDDDFVIQKLSTTVALQKKWINETRRRIYFACGEL